MSRKDLARIWTVLGMIVFYLTIEAFMRTRGVDLNLSKLIYSGWKHYSAAIFGILFGAPLMFIMLFLSRYHRKKLGDNGFLSSLPRAFNIQVNLAERIGRVYQVTFFTCFLVIPMVGQLYFLIHMIHGTVYYTGGIPFVSGLDHFLKPVPLQQIFAHDMFRYGNNTGPSFIPFYQPWFFLIIEIGLMIIFAKNFFKRRK